MSPATGDLVFPQCFRWGSATAALTLTQRDIVPA